MSPLADNTQTQFGDEPEPRDNDEYFAMIVLAHNYQLTKSYLFVALAQHSEHITNLSYFTFLIKTYDTNEIVCVATQVITFFPFEQRQLNRVYQAHVGRRNLSFTGCFLVFQIYKVKSLRASSTLQITNEIISELNDINEQSEANINCFWQLMKPSTQFINTFGSSIHKNLVN